MGGGALLAVRLRGRLGNNLFQYALGRALTAEGPVVVDDLYTSHQPLVDALRPGEVRLLTPAEALALRQPPRMRRGRRRVVLEMDRARLPEPVGGWLRARRRREREQGVFDPTVLDLRPPALLEGYFQHERYFATVADRVAAAFRPPASEVSDVLDGFRRTTGEGQTVAVVVRAGSDYEEAGWVQPLDWYRRAAELVADSVGRPRFAVFSDVPLAAESLAEALGGVGPGTPLVRLDPLTQLHLIASMDHAVVSATSFGWWGAWMGDQRRGFPDDRLVVVPDPWLMPALHDVPAARWKRLPV